ncbi:unnamed protein product [Closterium sp. NIES-54]
MLTSARVCVVVAAGGIRIIQDNYAKIGAVEKELEALHLEVKLTSGSKKAGMELLRQKIEQSTEKARLLRKKEEQAKKVGGDGCAWTGMQLVEEPPICFSQYT